MLCSEVLFSTKDKCYNFSIVNYSIQKLCYKNSLKLLFYSSWYYGWCGNFLFCYFHRFFNNTKSRACGHDNKNKLQEIILNCYFFRWNEKKKKTIFYEWLRWYIQVRASYYVQEREILQDLPDVWRNVSFTWGLFRILWTDTKLYCSAIKFCFPKNLVLTQYITFTSRYFSYIA